MSDFELHIKFGNGNHKLNGTIEYESSQIMRIRVEGKERSILLETNYPMIKNSKGKMTWKLREGSFTTNDKRTAEMLTDIMQQLEYNLKGKNVGRSEYIGRDKW